jgi:hypothetical protein
MLKPIALSAACLAGLAIMPGDDIELAQDTPPIPVTVYQHPDLDTTTSSTIPEPVRSVEITAEVVWADEQRQPTTTVVTTIPPMMDRCPEWQTVALEQGWPADEQLLNTLDRVIYRESRCDPTQHNPEDPMGGSHGLTQLNGFWCRPTQYWPDGWLQTHDELATCDDLYDPATNLRAALLIWHNSGWAPWGI